MSAAKNKKFRPPQPKPSPAQVTPPDAAPSRVPPPESTSVPPATITPWWQTLLAALVIVVAGVLAYSNSFKGDFVLDDLPAIKENLTIQQGWSPPPPAAPPAQAKTVWDKLHQSVEALFQKLPLPMQPPNEGQTVTGRPLVNISFEQNYVWSKQHSPNQSNGFQPEGYHVVSLVIHLLAALALFGLVRRTLELPKVRGDIGGGALPVAFTAALLWTVHPLQTESVTYISQRAESLMGLFYILALYCFGRGTQKWPWLWQPLAVLSCLTAAFCKEVTATLPVMILFYDWIFIAKNPLEAFKRRWPVYAGLLITMLPLGLLMLHSGSRGHSAGFGQGVTMYDYAVAQYPAILNYLKLTVWPHPLALDYGGGTDLAGQPYTFGDAAAMLAMMALAGGALVLLWRKPMLGFLGVWFFVILAPSSSIMPVVTEIAAEHRMYLSLAALAVFAALGLWRLLGWRTLPAALALAVALGALTFARNHAYRTGFDMWRDAVAKHPDNARAHQNFGIMLYQNDRLRESVAEYRTALRLRPYYPDCENNLGNSLGALGENEEAVTHYSHAVNHLVRPLDQAVAAYNMGNALRALDRWDDALKAYNFAGNLAHYAPAFQNMGTVYAQFKKYDEAIACYTQALNCQPVFPACEVNLANTYAEVNQPGQAEQHYLRALQEDPNYADAYFHLAMLHANQGKFADAAREFATTAQLVPASPDVRFNLGICLLKLGRNSEAAREFQAALQLKPDYPDARRGLEQAQGGARPVGGQ